VRRLPSSPLTDPDVRISRIRFFTWQVRSETPSAEGGVPDPLARRTTPGRGNTPEQALLSVSVLWTRDQVAEYLACFLLTVLPSWWLLPSPGSSWGEYPRFDGTIRHYDFPFPLPNDFWIRRSAPALALAFAPAGTRAVPAAWLPWGTVRRRRTDLRLGRRGSHRFLGCPFRALALLSDPGRTSTPHLTRCCGAAPVPTTTKAPATKQLRGSIPRLQHRLSTLHDEYRYPPCQTRLRLVVSLSRKGVEPSGHR